MTIATPDMDIWRGKDWADATEQQLRDKELAEAFGWTSIAALMGGSLSISPLAVRPNRTACTGGVYYVAPVGAPGILDPYVGIDGQWYNRGIRWGGHCSCLNAREVRLPGPIGRVESVTVDGEVIPPTAYAVVDGDRLVRVDGQTWPQHQDMYEFADGPHTFVVRYFRGSAPDELDAFCAGVLALELYKLLQSGDKAACRLPRNVTNVVRQGVSYDLGESGFADGKSGIPEVDAIVSRRNPHLLRTPSIVMSIDTMAETRTTTIAPGAPGGFGFAAAGTLVADPANPGYYTTKES